MKNEIIRIGQIGIHFLLESAETNGSVAMFEFTVPVGAKVPLPHSHKHNDETIYGVAGVITFTVEGKVVDIGPGESCFIPRGAIHGFNNLKQTDAKALAVVTPALIGPDLFAETAAIVNAGGPPEVEKLRAVMAKHGLVAVMPQAHQPCPTPAPKTSLSGSQPCLVTVLDSEDSTPRPPHPKPLPPMGKACPEND